MLLELEIARITGWVHHRVLPPADAARALTHLLSLYLKAAGRPLNLSVFEQAARSLFEGHTRDSPRETLETMITERAWRLLGHPAPTQGHLIAFSV